MTNAGAQKDMVILVPDLDIESTMNALLSRQSDLGIRPITFDLRRHPERDSGCCTDCHNFLRPLHNQYRYAMVVFDHHGSGKDKAERTQIEAKVEKNLHDNGWADRSAAIVIAPELEAWVWSDSPAVDEIMGWTGRTSGLRPWVKACTKHWGRGEAKPERPKEAFDAALREVGRPHSASIFKELAATVSVNRCTDPAFSKFKRCVWEWFPD